MKLGTDVPPPIGAPPYRPAPRPGRDRAVPLDRSETARVTLSHSGPFLEWSSSRPGSSSIAMASSATRVFIRRRSASSTDIRPTPVTGFAEPHRLGQFGMYWRIKQDPCRNSFGRSTYRIRSANEGGAVRPGHSRTRELCDPATARGPRPAPQFVNRPQFTTFDRNLVPPGAVARRPKSV